MNNKYMDTHHKHNHFFLTAVFSLMVAIFLLLIISVVVINLNLNKNLSLLDKYNFTTNYQPFRQPTPVLNKGQLTLAAKAGKTVFERGEMITIVVVADSFNRSIAGWDALVNYNGLRLDFVRSRNLLPDFQIFTNKKEANVVVITGTQKLTASGETVFAATPLVELTFKQKQSRPPVSSQRFDLTFIQNSTTDSNLITTDSKDILGKVEGVTVTISQ